jgi:hypothetical protein
MSRRTDVRYSNGRKIVDKLGLCTNINDKEENGLDLVQGCGKLKARWGGASNRQAAAGALGRSQLRRRLQGL